MNDILQVKNLSAAYGKNLVLQDITFSVNAHDCWAIIGRNGTGKSTLIKCLAKLAKISSGQINLNGKSIHEYHARDYAHWISYVPQSQGRNIPYTVYDYVMLGRYAKQGFLAMPGHEDRQMVEESLALTDVSQFAERLLDTLSGGEEQRVFLAGAVAQKAKIMLLDEPTTFLDPFHESLFYQILKKIHDRYDVTVISVTHNINAAIHQYSHILALKDGTVYFSGTREEFLEQSPEIIKEIYSISFQELSDTKTGQRIFTTLC